MMMNVNVYLIIHRQQKTQATPRSKTIQMIVTVMWFVTAAGSVLEAMAMAVEKAVVVIVCLSQK